MIQVQLKSFHRHTITKPKAQIIARLLRPVHWPVSLFVWLTGGDKVFVTAFDECLIQHSHNAGWDWVPSQNPPKTHSRCLKYSFTTRFIKNETYHGPRSFIHFDYWNKRQKNERLKHGGRAILYLSYRFVAICFVTNNSVCWSPAVILLGVRQPLQEELSCESLWQITVCPGLYRLCVRLQQLDLWPVQDLRRLTA